MGVYGNSFESFLVAVFNPKKEAVERWAAENGISGNFDALCKNTRVKEYILGHLTKIAKEKKLKGFEFIKALHLDPVPFDMERDLLTPTFEMKKAPVAQVLPGCHRLYVQKCEISRLLEGTLFWAMK